MIGWIIIIRYWVPCKSRPKCLKSYLIVTGLLKIPGFFGVSGEFLNLNCHNGPLGEILTKKLSELLTTLIENESN